MIAPTIRVTRRIDKETKIQIVKTTKETPRKTTMTNAIGKEKGTVTEIGTAEVTEEAAVINLRKTIQMLTKTIGRNGVVPIIGRIAIRRSRAGVRAIRIKEKIKEIGRGTTLTIGSRIEKLIRKMIIRIRIDSSRTTATITATPITITETGKTITITTESKTLGSAKTKTEAKPVDNGTIETITIETRTKVRIKTQTAGIPITTPTRTTKTPEKSPSKNQDGLVRTTLITFYLKGKGQLLDMAG